MRLRLYRTLFVLFLFCEILLTTSQRMRYMGERENSVVTVLLAMLMGLFAVLAAFEKPSGPQPTQGPTWESWLLKAVAGVGIGLCIFHFHREISVIPIDVRLSDIIPTIQVMDHRILTGQYAYDVIKDFGWDLSPTYLPMMWLPFLPAAIFHFDERWVGFSIWAIASMTMIWRMHRRSISTEAKWLLTALPFFHFIIIEEATDATYGNTIELMIAGFYMLLGLQLDNIRAYLNGSPIKKGALFAFFIVLCLLSRYSFILWLPLCFAVVWVEQKKLAISTAAWTTLGVLGIFVLPFLLKDPMLYFNGLKYYSEGALGCWNNNDGSLSAGHGLANIFRKEWPGEMAARLAALQRAGLIFSLASSLVCGLIWWKKRAQMQHLPLFLLGSLKFYFAFFYGLIQMPYTYLMLTPCFFSIVVLLAFYSPAPPALRTEA